MPADHTRPLSAQLAREPERVIEWLKKLPSSISRDVEVALVAVELATEHPADAERAFNLREVGGDEHRSYTAPCECVVAWLELIRRVPVVSPRRWAFRGTRLAWAFVALGLAEKGNADASLASTRQSTRSISSENRVRDRNRSLL